jgi:4a-hydroxytetrahydrobiopterin dehydratase
MPDLLSDDEVESGLPDGWTLEDDEIVRVYEFGEYLRGVNFAQLVGEIAEAQNHHPTMVLRYNELEIRLSTHEAGGVTDRDLEMAQLIEAERND